MSGVDDAIYNLFPEQTVEGYEESRTVADFSENGVQRRRDHPDDAGDQHASAQVDLQRSYSCSVWGFQPQDSFSDLTALQMEMHTSTRPPPREIVPDLKERSHPEHNPFRGKLVPPAGEHALLNSTFTMPSCEFSTENAQSMASSVPQSSWHLAAPLSAVERQPHTSWRQQPPSSLAIPSPQSAQMMGGHMSSWGESGITDRQSEVWYPDEAARMRVGGVGAQPFQQPPSARRCVDEQTASEEVERGDSSPGSRGSPCGSARGGGGGAKPAPRPRRNRKPMFWTPEDHQKFLEGLKKFHLENCLGPDGAELMAMFMGNRTPLQIRSHAQKYYSERQHERAAASLQAEAASAGELQVEAQAAAAQAGSEGTGTLGAEADVEAEEGTGSSDPHRAAPGSRSPAGHCDGS